jgi:hypothetical protein
MSFDNVDGTSPVLVTSGFSYIDSAIPQVEQGASLGHVLGLLEADRGENDLVLQPTADAFDLDGDVDPLLINYEPDMPTDGGGGGNIEVYEPAIYVPAGFVADDLYAVEFILDSLTGVLTINLLFSTDPLDHQSSLLASSSLLAPLSDAFVIDPDFDDPTAMQAPANGSRCTVVLTKTTTSNSGSSSVSFLGGLISYTVNSGSSSTTTTTTITVEGQMVNGRCVVSGDKR